MKPGQHKKTFKSKSGKTITLRYPIKEDVDKLLEYINALSLEDTYISMGGEQLSMEDEKKWLDDVLSKMEKKDMVHLAAFDGDKLVGTTAVERDTEGRSRTAHIGKLGISVKKEYREDGIGKELLNTVVKLASEHLGVSLIVLSKHEHNTVARNLYESAGFTEFGRLPEGNFYKDTYSDEIYMYKKL